jgi:hypothetical protein
MASHPSRGGPPGRHNPLVAQWAELLSALDEGSPSISTSADQMAEDLPGDLVEPVNAELRQRGCSYQVTAPTRPGHEGSSKRRLEERGTARPGGRDAA